MGREIITFFDLLTRVLLLQPSMSLGFTTVWGHCFVFKLFYTVKPQSCFLFSHLSVSGWKEEYGLALIVELCDVPFGQGIAMVVHLALFNFY